MRYSATFLSLALLLLQCNATHAAHARPAQEQVAEEVRLSESVAYLLTLSEAEMLRIIPQDSRGIFWTTCPHCRKRSRVALWKWEPQTPRQITCEDCHTRFPHKDYPDDTYVEVKSEGPAVRFHYYAPKDGPVQGKRYFLRAAADFRAKTYMAEKAMDFAQLYQLTGREDYAQRAFAILKEFARVFPRYPYIYDGEWHGKEVAFFPPNAPVRDQRLHALHQPCRWAFWGFMDIPRELLMAYDSLGEWQGLQSEDGRKNAQLIEKNIFAPQIEHVLSFPETHTGNMSISAKWPDLLLAARLLNRPDLARETVGNLKKFQAETFLYDGSWWETSPSYASQISKAGLRRLPLSIHGTNKAAPGEEETGAREIGAALVSQFETVQQSLEETRLPNGRLLPINDTWALSRLEPRQETKPVLWPGLGIALLGGGKGASQWHSYLNFTSGRSHKHADALSIGLTIGDKELLSDIGYTHSRYQPWTQSTHAHNTVVVNGTSSNFDKEHEGHRLLHFFEDRRGFQLASAHSQTAYKGLTSRYERTLALLGSDASDAFLIDLFEVAGSTQHDYLLHGSADEDSTASMGELTLKPYNGTLMAQGATFTPPTTERASIREKRDNFGYVNAIKHAQSPGGTVELSMALKATPPIGTRTLLATEAGDDLFLGQAPSVRRTIKGHLKEDEAKLDLYQAPFFSWRRTGSRLQSTYAAVHQPINSTRRVHTLQKIKTTSGGTLLRIDFGEGETAYFAKGASPQSRVEGETEHGRFILDGGIGLLRLKQGKVQEGRLLGGTSLSLGEYALQGRGRLSGEMLQALRAPDSSQQAFDLEGELPAGDGNLLILTFPDNTERAYVLAKKTILPNGKTRVFSKQEAGFTVTGGKTVLTTFPQREIPGTNIRYHLDTITTDFPTQQ